MIASRGLVLDGVTIGIGRRMLIPPLDVLVAPGEIVTVMGPSGSGKSSLLAYLCGTLDPAFRATGRLTIDGTDLSPLPAERRRLGILFQDHLLFPHLSVGENLAFGLPAAIRGRRERMRRVDAALGDIGLDGYGGRDPATLSGGQRARVALMRTLLAEPRALLLDEPFSKLDAALRDRIRAFVLEHARAGLLPTLLVTHDPGDAAAAAGRVILIEAQDEDPAASMR